jgi:hypothetical protein
LRVVREEGLAAGGATLYIEAADAAAFLTQWPLALGFPDAVGRGVRYWPHRPVLPTVGDSLAAVARSGRDSKRRGLQRQEPDAVSYDVRCTFVENFDSTYYFSKIMTN